MRTTTLLAIMILCFTLLSSPAAATPQFDVKALKAAGIKTNFPSFAIYGKEGKLVHFATPTLLSATKHIPSLFEVIDTIDARPACDDCEDDHLRVQALFAHIGLASPADHVTKVGKPVLFIIDHDMDGSGPETPNFRYLEKMTPAQRDSIHIEKLVFVRN